MKNLKNKKGITLVALIITIIILLILSGVAISQLTDSGLFEKTKLAKETYKNAVGKENQILIDMEQLKSTRDESDAIAELRQEITNLKSKKTVVDFTTGNSATTDWIKIISYPSGFTYDNCYITSAYAICNNWKYYFNYYDGAGSSKLLIRQKDDGIYVYYGSSYTNSQGKIILEKY